MISPKEYNRKTGLALVCPVTSHVKGYPFEVLIPNDLTPQGVILADQLKSLDWRARRVLWIARAPVTVVAEVRAKAMTLLS